MHIYHFAGYTKDLSGLSTTSKSGDNASKCIAPITI
jgi:hypothetical protein